MSPLYDIIKSMNDIEIWYKKYAKRALTHIGIKKGQVVLDFGAGEGYYTLPISEILGKKGRVYAYDKDVYALGRLNKSKEEKDIENVIIVRPRGKIHSLPFKDAFFDVVLLYDVLHSYYFNQDERLKVLREIFRVLKDDGFTSVFPKHIEERELKKEANMSGFCLFKRIPLKLLHYGFLEDGTILNFKKCVI